MHKQQFHVVSIRRPGLIPWAFLFFLMVPAALLAQPADSSRVPVYPVSYTLPDTGSIWAQLQRVRKYYEATSTKTIINKDNGKTITDFSSPDKAAIVSPGLSAEWTYTNGVVLSAFDYIDKMGGDPAFFANNSRFYDFVIRHLPYFKKNAAAYGEKASGWPAILYMHALDDCGSIGSALIKTYQKTKNKNYTKLIQLVADYISHKQFRLPDGTLARHRPQYESVWADDLYMSVPFLANMAILSGDTTYFDDAVKQVLQMSERLYIPQTELIDHGWNITSGDYDPRFYWGRANGWTLMTMAELLSVLPANYKGRDQILHLYRSIIRSITNLQDGTGFWHNLLDKTDTYLETSCTAMFCYAIAKGINEGWVSHVYGPVALTAWNAVNTRILPNGAVDGTCEGTTFAHDNTYYYNRGKSIHATHGYGPVFYAGAEMIKLLKNDRILIQKANPGSINSTFHFILKLEWPDKK